MSSVDIQNNSAMMKRAEQLKRWEESDTNRAAPTPRHSRTGRHIKFSSGCIFLAACLSGDQEDVLKLIDDGADINTANVDGLTALHQACIDDKLEMVEFLVQHGADINRQDNEGWTPLHATASCGFVSIARYLVENNADVAAVNSDGDLALDLAIDVQHMPMIDYMEKVVQELNIDVDQARKAEEKAMLSDANKWLLSDASEVDRPNPKTGATALHVAAAKGYTHVLSLLLAGRANVDRQDNDGWTPLHAAAHWGQKETAEMLVDAWGNMDIRNYAGQSCIDVADRKMVKFLEELRANKRNKRRPSSQISRISDAIENHVDKTPTKLVRVEVRTDAAKDAENVKPNQQIHVAEHSVEDEAPWRRKTLRTPNDSPTKNQVPDKELSGKSGNESANDVILRRTHSFENDQKKPIAPVSMLNAATTTTTPTTTVLSSPSTAVHTPPIRSNSSAQSSSNNNNGSTTASASVSDVETPKPKQSATNIFKNFFKSFVPPVRDEESETQRKAHAKRVRETRRSTQGVTLDEIKSAEELVKKKNLGMNKNNNNNNNNSFKLEDITSGGTYPPNQSTIIPSAPAVMAAVNLASTAGTPRRISSGPNALNASNQSLNSVGRPVSAPSETINNSAYMTPPARRYETSSAATTTTATTTANNSASATAVSANHATSATSATTSHDDKDNDKENDNRTQTVIQRRRKPKRRSTGVVHLDMDELEQERQQELANNDNDEKEKESGSERTSRSRTTSTATTSAASESKSDKAENGDGIDYKALWEAAKSENDKLKQMLKQKDDEVVQTRATLERFANATTKNSLSEIEKRERRAMERKLSELEEELKQLDVYKSDNHRLKEENAALIRVISKLSK